MSQRNSGYTRKQNDAYYTPSWVTEALINSGYPFRGPVWEPACGNGNIVNVLKHRFQVVATDMATTEIDFMKCDLAVPGVQAIITNPPYTESATFIQHAIDLMRPVGGQVAMLLRTDYDHAATRKYLFGSCPQFAKKLVLLKRIVWFVEANGKPKASPSFNHAWYVWDWRHDGLPTIGYIGG
jgi:hypothetical protein